jgi:hypothetical protein
MSSRSDTIAAWLVGLFFLAVAFALILWGAT